MTDSIFVEYFRANLMEQYNEDFNCDFEDINKPKQTDNTNLSIEHYSSENYIDTNAQENDNSEEEAFEDINRIIKRKKNNDEDYVPSGSEKEEEEEDDNEESIKEEEDKSFIQKKRRKKKGKEEVSTTRPANRFLPNIEGVYIPKMKHLNVEKKKNRIQFQKNHRKTIYSFISLTPPYDFTELFELVKKHQEKHNNEKKKSFHFIRDINGHVKIVTFEEKKEYRRLGQLDEFE